MAHRDPVTGVNNRTVIDSALMQEMDLANRQIVPLSMIIFDIDKFKQINYSCGRIAGAAELKRAADRRNDPESCCSHAFII